MSKYKQICLSKLHPGIHIGNHMRRIFISSQHFCNSCLFFPNMFIVNNDQTQASGMCQRFNNLIVYYDFDGDSGSNITKCTGYKRHPKADKFLQ